MLVAQESLSGLKTPRSEKEDGEQTKDSSQERLSEVAEVTEIAEIGKAERSPDRVKRLTKVDVEV